jgi:transposase
MEKSWSVKMRKRQTFSKEFKLEALRQLERGDKPGTEVARNLGIRRNLLYKWKDQLSDHGTDAFQGSGRKPANQSDELTRLKKELELR